MISDNLYVIAAICGNFYQESTVNPGIWENLTIGAPGYGLGQWTDNPPQVMRRTALFDWLDAHGYAHDDGDGQLAFLVDEDLWVPSLIQPSAYATLGDFFRSTSTNLSDLVLEFMFHWEGINDGTDPVRLSFAQTFLSAFQNDDGTRWPWYSSNSYNSITNATRNALRVLDYFKGTASDEELLAMLRLARKRKMRGGLIIW